MPNPIAGGTALANNCGFEGGAPPPVSGPGDLYWGTRDTSHNASTLAQISSGLASGIIVRGGLNWAAIDPNATGTPTNWADIDRRINGRNGCRLLLRVSGGNGTGGHPSAAGYPAGYVSKYASAMAAIVQRYSAPALWAIEFYNEPEGWTAAQIAEVANAAANAIAPVNAAKPAAARTKVLVGVLNGTHDYTGPDAKVNAMYDGINGNPNIPYVSFHPYHRVVAPEYDATIGGSHQWQTFSQKFAPTGAAHHFTGNWIADEFGAPTHMPTLRQSVTEAQQAQWLVRQAIMGWAHSSGRIRYWTQFCWDDGGTSDGAEANRMGMIRAAGSTADDGTNPGAGTKKPLYYAWQTLCNVIDINTINITPLTFSDPVTSAPFSYKYDRGSGRYGYVFWTAIGGGTSSITLNGLPATVRRTCASVPPAAPPVRGGPWAQGTLATTNGAITLTSTNYPTFVDGVW